LLVRVLQRDQLLELLLIDEPAMDEQRAEVVAPAQLRLGSKTELDVRLFDIASLEGEPGEKERDFVSHREDHTAIPARAKF
jgi:hypothetical protein